MKNKKPKEKKVMTNKKLKDWKEEFSPKTIATITSFLWKYTNVRWRRR
jgi:hypothetical protein